VAHTAGPGPEDQWDAATKRRRVLQARREGATWEQAAVYAGYADRSAAYNAIKGALKNEREQLAHDLIEQRQIEDDRDDDLRQRLYKILDADHLVVSDGRIVKDEEGIPLKDPRPVLMAVDRLGRIADRYALRHGLNAPKELKIALDARQHMEASVVADTLLRVAEAMGLDPSTRQLMLEHMQRELTAVASEQHALGD
jgi:hypothetical protein